MKSVDRPGSIVLSEATSMLAFKATAAMYEEQPELWERGERGRARTLEDFHRHFEALTALDDGLFADHVAYCRTLFENLGFPSRWLDDAWRIMADTVRRELAPNVADQAIRVLRSGSDVAPQDSRRDGA